MELSAEPGKEFIRRPGNAFHLKEDPDIHLHDWHTPHSKQGKTVKNRRRGKKKKEQMERKSGVSRPLAVDVEA